MGCLRWELLKRESELALNLYTLHLDVSAAVPSIPSDPHRRQVPRCFRHHVLSVRCDRSADTLVR